MSLHTKSDMEYSDHTSYRFQPFDIEGTFSRVFAVFVANWGVFLTINAISILLIYCLTIISALVLVGSVLQGAEPNTFLVAVAFAVELIVFYCIQCIADGANIRAVAEAYAGRKPNALACIAEASARLGSLMAACFLVVVCLILLPLVTIASLLFSCIGTFDELAVMVFIIFGGLLLTYALYIALITYHMYPSIMIENMDGLSSIGRSLNLSQGYRCYTFSTLLLFGIVKMIVNALISNLARTNNAVQIGDEEMQFNVDLNLGGGGDGILGVAFGILFAALGSIFQAVVYFNIRVTKEAYTREDLLEDLDLSLDDYSVMDADDATNQKRSSPTLV